MQDGIRAVLVRCEHTGAVGPRRVVPAHTRNKADSGYKLGKSAPDEQQAKAGCSHDYTQTRDMVYADPSLSRIEFGRKRALQCGHNLACRSLVKTVEE